MAAELIYRCLMVASRPSDNIITTTYFKVEIFSEETSAIMFSKKITRSGLQLQEVCPCVALRAKITFNPAQSW